MALTFLKNAVADAKIKRAEEKKAEAKHAKLLKPALVVKAKTLPIIDLHKPGRLRVNHVAALLGISRATVYRWIKNGHCPPPDGKDSETPYWFTSTILPLVEKAKE